MVMRQRTARRPGPIGIARAQRRNTAWDDRLLLGSAIDVPAGGRSSLQLALNVSDPEKRGCTVVRIIMDLVVWPIPPGAVSGVDLLSMGVQMVSDDAFAAGAMADPEDDADFPVTGWLYRGVFLVRDETLATGIGDFTVVQKDLRVQRKMDRGTLVLTVHNTGLEGTFFTIRTTGIVRVLYKLP